MDAALRQALMEGYDSVLTESGLIGKALTIGALLFGTIFSGCSAGGRQHVSLDLPENAPVNRDNVTELAMKIADEIHDEMKDSSRVEDTKSWQAAKKIYSKLNQGDTRSLANSFSRIINRQNNDLSAPPCCDETVYNNMESNPASTVGTYNAEENTWEY